MTTPSDNTTVPVPTDDLRARLTEALAPWCRVHEITEAPCERCALRLDAVIAELAVDPGDLPARMAAAIKTALEQWATPGLEETKGIRKWDFIARAAMGVRDEQMVYLEARARHAEGELSSRRDHNTRWETERARADKAVRRLELAHKARQAAEERLDACRKALADDNYFADIEIGPDVAPRLVERLSVARETEEYATTLKDQVAALQRELAEAKAEFEAEEKLISDLRDELDGLAAESQAQHAAAEEDIRRARGQRDEARRELTEAKRAVYAAHHDHIRDTHPDRPHIADCLGCRVLVPLSAAMPARPDDSEAIRRLAQATTESTEEKADG